METIQIIAETQELILYRNLREIRRYSISTGKNGLGEQKGSEMTPRGWHIIRAKIGDSQPLNTVFKARRATGEIYYPELMQEFPDRDWILTRILWLSGTELHKNRLGNCDTMRRYIYIHGTPDEFPMGVPQSHGCIRMRNNEIVELFEKVVPGTRVLITEKYHDITQRSFLDPLKI